MTNLCRLFRGGLMLLDFEAHRYHRRIMQQAFTRARLRGTWTAWRR